jgi:hypothetical protein
LLASAIFVSSAAAAPPAQVTVQVDKPGVKVSPALWGLFFG